PFPVAERVEQVVSYLNNPIPVPPTFLETFCAEGSQTGALELLQTVLFSPVPGENPQKTKCCLVYAGGLSGGYYESLQHIIQTYDEHHFVIAYRGMLDEQLKEIAELYQGRVTLLGLLTAFQFTLSQRLALFFPKKKFGKNLYEFFSREAHRLFGGLQPDITVDFCGNHKIMAGILHQLSGEKFFVKHTDFLSPLSCRKVQQLERTFGFQPMDLTRFEEAWLKKNPEFLKEDAAARSTFQPILPLYLNVGKKMVCLSLFKFKTTAPLSLAQATLQIDEKNYPIICTGGKKKKSKGWGLCKFSLDLEQAVSLPAKNTVFLSCPHPLGEQITFPLSYCAMPRNLFIGLRGPMAVDKATQTVAIFRQSLENQLMVYVRSVNVTDTVFQRLKQTAAFGLSLFWHTQKAKNLILLYEKNGSKYEESASVLYEELLNQEYENAYFLITKDSAYLPRVAERYRKNLLYKYTFRHYLYFFKTKRFIGTEAIAHAIDLKTFNLLALKKIADKNVNYVFLQHGVMYMVSLNSE
ncbi:MAG: CDP-glycerol glycerophosphotransferase family protein, partial [Clostridia bacterium]|nr:CDP-glycerol glycerophosphotransferase family protein [Clostridia bacterium]